MPYKYNQPLKILMTQTLLAPISQREPIGSCVGAAVIRNKHQQMLFPVGAWSATTVTGTTVAWPAVTSFLIQQSRRNIGRCMDLRSLDVLATIARAWSNVNLPNGRMPAGMGYVALKTAEGA